VKKIGYIGGEKITKYTLLIVVASVLFVLPAVGMDSFFDINEDNAVEYYGMNADLIWIGDQIAQTMGPFTTPLPFDKIPVTTNAFGVDKTQRNNADELPINAAIIEIEDQYAMALGSGIAKNTANVSDKSISGNSTILGPVGWAIGWYSNNTAAILHTQNGGKAWEVQGNSALWTGVYGTDISAVDEWTAWAALLGDANGAIIHTTDGGTNWNPQPLPDGINEGVKGIKGLSRNVAWAVTIGGTVMRTLDGGENWIVIPHEGITIKQVNRIDAKGDDIWIADYGSGEYGMIHSPDFGVTWRRERLPDISDGPMAVSIVSSQIAWATVRPEANLYRTVDGGGTWHLDAPDVSGPNDLDDICAPDADTVWAVQNLNTAGNIIRVRLVNGNVTSDVMDPTRKYRYEGVTCFDEKTVWVVGIKAYGVDPSFPDGVILHTNDGTTWTNQPLPVNDVALWKVSFADAHR